MSEDPGTPPTGDISGDESLRRSISNSSDSDTDEYLKDVAGFVKNVRYDLICDEKEEELHWSDIG